jgi:hypothetical protein
VIIWRMGVGLGNVANRGPRVPGMGV